MFILGTTETILWVCQVAVNIPILQELVDAGANFSRATFPANVLDRFFILRIVTQFVPVVNKLVTDLLFLYRCYKIWGSRKKVVIFPAILVLFTAVIASVVVSPLQETLDFDVRIPFAMFAVTNLVLMGLTAGRIWWLQRREAFHVDVDDTFRNRYKMPIVLMYGLTIMHAGGIFLAVYSGARQPLLAYRVVLGASSQIVAWAITFKILSRVSVLSKAKMFVRDKLKLSRPIQVGE
ncbi:hypothetical protein GGX14DRAFT_546958 [Mycena pura]|uniref:Uncharacterized protein n=1 Tax=Mycena pura TaxID=153505 RepID=A0AAD6UPL4_9AGAR|nr:hypothetical protein GGX14DRAFT_546958 [Mycena pura]